MHLTKPKQQVSIENFGLNPATSIWMQILQQSSLYLDRINEMDIFWFFNISCDVDFHFYSLSFDNQAYCMKQ